MKNDIVRLFDKATPVMSDDEMLTEILRKAEKMEKSNIKSRKLIKKPLIAVCAAAGAAVLGIAGASAAGFFSFNDIFGNYIVAENEAVGDTLLAEATDFSSYISDDSYQIELKGVAGTPTEIIAYLQLVRKDGKPVIDDFRNEYNPKDNIVSSDKVMCNDRMGYNRYIVDENGNIEIELNLCSPESLSGERLTAEGKGFYPTEQYYDFVTRENISPENIFEADTDDFIYLPVEWSFSFVYEPVEGAVTQIEADSFSENITLNCESYADNGERAVFTSDFTPVKLDLTATRATLKLKDINSGYGANFTIPSKDNTVSLIKKNGEEINAFISYSSSSHNGDTEFGIHYSKIPVTYDEEGGIIMKIMAIDVTEISALKINGTILPL